MSDTLTLINISGQGPDLFLRMKPVLFRNDDGIFPGTALYGGEGSSHKQPDMSQVQIQQKNEEVEEHILTE